MTLAGFVFGFTVGNACWLIAAAFLGKPRDMSRPGDLN